MKLLNTNISHDLKNEYTELWKSHEQDIERLAETLVEKEKKAVLDHKEKGFLKAYERYSAAQK
jgi:lysozyme family protein